MLSNVLPLTLCTICCLPWETVAVKSGASSKAPDRASGGVGSTRAHAPRASGLCLNPTIRPPGSLPGEADQSTSFYMERVHQLRKSSCENVCGQQPPNPDGVRDLWPQYTRGAQKPDSHLSPTWAQHLFFPPGLLGTAISQTSYHKFTEYRTVLKFLNRFTFVGNTITRSKNKKPWKGRNWTLPPILLPQLPVSEVLKKQVLSCFFPSFFPISLPSSYFLPEIILKMHIHFSEAYFLLTPVSIWTVTYSTYYSALFFI